MKYFYAFLHVSKFFAREAILICMMFGFSNLQLFTSYSYVFPIKNAQMSLVLKEKQPNFTTGEQV